MRVRIAILALVVLLSGACVSPRKTVFIDQAAHTGPPVIRAIYAEGNRLRVSLKQTGLPAWVAAVKAQVIEGDVYLYTINISSVVHTIEFAVDLSGPEFPRDWRNRLYWIEEESITSPINPTVEHVREIRRSRIILNE